MPASGNGHSRLFPGSLSAKSARSFFGKLPGYAQLCLPAVCSVGPDLGVFILHISYVQVPDRPALVLGGCDRLIALWGEGHRQDLAPHTKRVRQATD